MRFSEFSKGSVFNVQNMNVIVMPEKEEEKKEVVNPGIEYGKDGKAKWSPPLQQNLDLMKYAVGTNTDDVTKEPQDDETTVEPKKDITLSRLKELITLFNKSQNFPAG